MPPRDVSEHGPFSQVLLEQIVAEQDMHADARTALTELREQVAELRLALRARDDFIAIAAHELRNPMTPLSGVAELALASARAAGATCPPRVTMLLERMQLLVQDFIARSTRLLDVSRIESGNLLLEPSSVDLSALLRAIVEKYELAALRASTPLEHAIQPGISGVLDPLAVEQIADNLITNALKFGAGKTLTLRLRAEAGTARLEVRDRGNGIATDQQDRIFGRFEQILAQHQGAGFGVGLWVASRLVTAMAGEITVFSRLGEGSTFTVTLPLAPSSAERSVHDHA